VQNIFSNHYFKVYTSDDIKGVEYCGALKNVFAIIAGMVDYKKMGQNTKNALITRGLYEISKIVVSLGGNINSVFGLTGIGDLMLTCNSFTSRNYSYGYNYLNNKEINGTIEGINTLYEIHNLSETMHLDTPIIHSLYLIFKGESTIEQETEALMARGKKDEFIKI
jgi:glycerol-3-phosphate dehydrogenase (NAD(P)+)